MYRKMEAVNNKNTSILNFDVTTGNGTYNYRSVYSLQTRRMLCERLADNINPV